MSLFVSSSFMPENIFCESSFTVQCILGNKINAITLVDTCATGYGFIDEKFAEIVCKTLEIEPQRLTKLKPIQGFDGRAAWLVTHAIYPILSVGNHTESLALLLIIKLGHHPMILGRPWMKKHEIGLDMINDSISFSPGYCSHTGAPSVSVSTMPTIETKMILIATQQDFLPNRILKRGSTEKIDDFLKTSEKILKKKSRLTNASKRKHSIPKTIMIGTLPKSGKDVLPILTSETEVSTLTTKQIYVAIIGADAYRTAFRLKRAQVFTVSMRQLEYQAEKEARPETDPRTVVPAKYHDLLDVFSKKNSDTLPPYRKYDHKIILEKEQKHSHAPLYKMLPQKLDAVKNYLDSHLAKGFIQASSASYSC